MTTEGQGRTNEPVGFGIPVIIDGPWAEPRMYPEMSGILDNPDQAYAKLREMGKGLFGKDGAGLGAALGGLLSGIQQPGGQPGQPGTGAPGTGQNNPLGGDLGATIGNLLQQGLGGLGGQQPQGAAPAQPQPQANAPRSQGRSIPSIGSNPAPAAAGADRLAAAGPGPERTGAVDPGKPADERRAAAAFQPVNPRYQR